MPKGIPIAIGGAKNNTKQTAVKIAVALGLGGGNFPAIAARHQPSDYHSAPFNQSVPNILPFSIRRALEDDINGTHRISLRSLGPIAFYLRRKLSCLSAASS